MKAELGKVTGAVLRYAEGVESDPMNAYVGMTPDASAGMAKIAADLGWTLPEIGAALDARLSEKAAYEYGTALMIPTGIDVCVVCGGQFAVSTNPTTFRQFVCAGCDV